MGKASRGKRKEGGYGRPARGRGPVSLERPCRSAWRLTSVLSALSMPGVTRLPRQRLRPAEGNGSALGKLTMTYRCKSYSEKAVAGQPRPSLAGVAATRGLKRRQEPCGVWQVSPEILSHAVAGLVPISQGNRESDAMRVRLSPPGSWTTSRTDSRRRDPGDPAGSVGVVTDGGRARGMTEARCRAEAGSRTGRPTWRG